MLNEHQKCNEGNERHECSERSESNKCYVVLMVKSVTSVMSFKNLIA